ncbi:MAG: diguanylate cyclase [Syntrophales bacterium]|nr:diguanylate cyclase [Syntrophales bacterium]
MSRSILIVSPDPATSHILTEILRKQWDTLAFKKFHLVLDAIYSEIPSILIVDIAADPEIVPLLNMIKDDPLFSGLPVLAILDDPDHVPDWNKVRVDDYIWRKDIEEEIIIKVNLCGLRSRRIVEVNPLTRLPGNISINRQIQRRLDEGESFALGYADLDYFKPYNDTYGFSRGDDVIRITGRLILNITKNRQPRNSFVGHIGGDDFLCLTDVDVMEPVCEEIIEAFNRIIPTFYDPEHRKAGFIKAYDRAGLEQTFPFISVSIGVVCADGTDFSHYGELTEIASEMKSFAKKHEGSCYRLNRRNYIAPVGKDRRSP